MPRYSGAPDLYPGTEMVPGWPVRVFDGGGREVERVVVVDTDTGEIIQQMANSAGEFFIDHEAGEIKRVRFFVPLPIRLEPVSPEEMVTVPLIVEGGPV